jgi:hypothetical protein
VLKLVHAEKNVSTKEKETRPTARFFCPDEDESHPQNLKKKKS